MNAVAHHKLREYRGVIVGYRTVTVAIAAACLVSCGRHHQQYITTAAPDSESLMRDAALARTGVPFTFDHPDCAHAASAPPAPGPAGDWNVRGLRVGGTLDDAVRYLKCLDKGAAVASESQTNGVSAIQYFGRSVRTEVEIAMGVPKAADVLLRGWEGSSTAPFDAGFERVRTRFGLLAFGAPHQEAVYGIEQTEYFQPSESPTLEVTQRSLLAKYGDDASIHSSYDTLVMNWVRGPDGRPIPRTDPRFNQCTTSGHVVHHDASEACGLTVGAEISLSRDNRLLVSQLTVGLLDQAKFVHTVFDLGAAWKREDSMRKQAAAARAAKKPGPSL